MARTDAEGDKGGEGRRPLKSRRTGWATRLLGLLLKTPLSANQISAIGILFAGAGAAAILWAPQAPSLWLLGALFIQLRLLANMMDGLVAVEGGRGSAVGGLWNEVPDRLEDSLFFVAAGYAVGLSWLGWLAALLAACAAYIRLLGGTLDLGQDFRGPMAKPQRMAALTLACVLATIEAWIFASQYAPITLLALIALGTVATLVRRIGRQGLLLSRRATVVTTEERDDRRS